MLRNEAAGVARTRRRRRESRSVTATTRTSGEHARAWQEALETAKSRTSPHALRGEAARSGSAGADEVTDDPDEQPDEQEVVHLRAQARRARRAGLTRCRRPRASSNGSGSTRGRPHRLLEGKDGTGGGRQEACKDLREEADTSTRKRSRSGKRLASASRTCFARAGSGSVSGSPGGERIRPPRPCSTRLG